ncbi:calcium-binding protein, partial [Phaeobacter sp. NW0010-22]|uniref:beta strand repeat-containing protein n=1 Tax=Phaeobacter sp. NW0010-22 TaxID=3135907 RepID=UPI003342DA32
MPTIISTNTTWTTGQTITLTDDVQIAAGATLTVEAGAVIEGNGYSIVSFGTLSASGIGAAQTVFNQVRFEFGYYSATPSRIEISNAVLNGGAFLPVGDAGYGNTGSFSLTDNLISGGGGSNIWFPTSDSVISGNIFFNSAGLSLATSSSAVTIENNAFIGASSALLGSAIIVAYSGDRLEVSGNTFWNDIPALEVTSRYGGNATITANGNYFGTTDLAAVDDLILDQNDDLSRPSVIDYGKPATGPNKVVIQALIAAGGDVATALASRGIVLGTSVDDTLVGTSEADMIIGSEGNDTLDGGLGADTLLGGSGDDLITFSSVSILHPSSTDTGLIDGGDGTDVLDLRNVSPASARLIRNEDASFSFGVSIGTQKFAVAGIETILFGSVDNHITTSYAGSITIDSGAGHDNISVSLDDGDMQNIYGGAGDDIYWISGLFGGAGGGVLDSGSGSNTLKTNISFIVDLAAGTAVSGGASFTVANFNSVKAAAWKGYLTSVYGDSGNNSFSVNDLFSDGSVGVYFDGRGGNDILSGSAGNDTLIGGAGADLLAGGAGIDLASYVTSVGGITVRLDGTGSTGDALGDTFESIENLTGSDHDDILVGSSFANALEGGSGNDTLIGGAGADDLNGGFGLDTASYAAALGRVNLDLRTRG